MSKEVKDLNIIAIGPLSNLAMALRLDPGFADRIASLTVMGGTYKGIGNITFNTEFNFRQDPEAASIVLKAGFKNFTLVPWECCLRASPTTPEHKSKLYDSSTPLGMLHKQTSDFMFSHAQMNFIIDTCCAIILIDKTCIKGSFDAYGVVDLAPGMSKGSLQYHSTKSMAYQQDLMKDAYGVDSSKPNIKIITHIDLDKAIDIIAKAKQGL